jgi:hypothetical protein
MIVSFGSSKSLYQWGFQVTMPLSGANSSHLPKHAISFIPKWSSSNALKLLHAHDADWVRLDRRDLESDLPYFDVFVANFDIHATRALHLEWGRVENFVNDVFREFKLDGCISELEK